MSRAAKLLELIAVYDRAVILIAMLSTASLCAAGTPMPLNKIGSCPSGYSNSGNYCEPKKEAHFALERLESCPSGYTTSGDYCLAGKDARLAILKDGNCPSGWTTSGKYCLKSR